MTAKSKSVAEVYLSRWSPKSDTYKTMRAALNRVAEVLGDQSAETYPWHKLRYDDVRGLPALLEKLEPATINKLLSAVRGVLEVAHDMGLIPDDDYARIRIKSVRGNTDDAGRALTDDEVSAIKVKLPELPLRDAVMVAVMIGAGARRVEIVKIKKEDYDTTTGRIALYGKGRKPRKVPVGKTWRPLIEAYFETLQPGQLAFPCDRRRVSYVVKKLSEAVGAKFTPHDFRRTFGTYICKVADVAVAQRLLGHTDVKTTLLYDRRGDEAEDDAVKDW
jgi:integrase